MRSARAWRLPPPPEHIRALRSAPRPHDTRVRVSLRPALRSPPPFPHPHPHPHPPSFPLACRYVTEEEEAEFLWRVRSWATQLKA